MFIYLGMYVCLFTEVFPGKTSIFENIFWSNQTLESIEAVVRTCSVKKVFLEISEYFLEITFYIEHLW